MICAQTKIELFNQLIRDGYTQAELRLILKSFDFSARIFAGRFQTCGKPFLAHGIGTASILGALRIPAEIVAAGLIHNLYFYGEFGYGMVGSSKAKIKMTRKTVGNEVAAFLARFPEFSIAPGTLKRHYENFQSYDAFERQLLLISLAETLEKFQNLEPLYQSNFETYRQWISEQGHLFIELCRRLEFPILADAYSSAFAEIESGKIPAALRRKDTTISFFLPPKTVLKKSRKPILTIKSN